MKFLIPSYKRAAKQKTLDYLAGMGYGKQQIIISTQTKEDYAEYQKRYGSKAQVIYGAAHNVAGNRNTLLRTLSVGEKAILLDDDITRFDRLIAVKDSKHPFGRFEPIIQKAQLEAVISRGFSACESEGANCFGAYSIHNERMLYGNMSRSGIWSKNRLYIGTFFAIVFTGQMFDERYDTKEDYAYLLEQIKTGNPVLRMNNISPLASHFTKGGCEDDWAGEGNYYSACLLVSQFPEYVAMNPKKHGEIKQRNTAGSEK